MCVLQQGAPSSGHMPKCSAHQAEKGDHLLQEPLPQVPQGRPYSCVLPCPHVPLRTEPSQSTLLSAGRSALATGSAPQFAVCWRGRGSRPNRQAHDCTGTHQQPDHWTQCEGGCPHRHWLDPQSPRRVCGKAPETPPNSYPRILHQRCHHIRCPTETPIQRRHVAHE